MISGGSHRYNQFQSLSGFQVRCNTSQYREDSVTYDRQFQSLSGFQVRCNVRNATHISLRTGIVSIPVGFSSPLQHWIQPGQRAPEAEVSIPVGFSSPLQLSCPIQPCVQLISFNPCRVFKSAATHYSPRCCLCSWTVSIPVGFSSPLQLPFEYR